MTVKELKQILGQFDENLQVGMAISFEVDNEILNGDDAEVVVDNPCYSNIWYNPRDNKIYLGGDGYYN